MKNLLWIVIGAAIGVSIIIPSMLLLDKKLATRVLALTGALTPEQAKIKQKLEAMVNQAPVPAQIREQLHGDMAMLTPLDYQQFAETFQYQLADWRKRGGATNPSIQPKIDYDAMKSLSPAAMVIYPILVAAVGEQARSEFKQTMGNMPAMGSGGGPAVPHNFPSLFEREAPFDRTEDDWIGRLVIQDIVGQVLVGLNLKQSLRDVHASGTINQEDDKADLTVRLIQWDDDPGLQNRAFGSPLSLEFAWDGTGYATVASLLIGTHPLPPPITDPDAETLLQALTNLTGPQLAREDVRISGLLQRNPLDPTLQSEAALILMAMAWREDAGLFGDNRRLLCKATAHLALARAADNLLHHAPDWNEQVADIALRTLAGREKDTLDRIDLLSAQKDIPDSAKTWLSALRVWATHDWRKAQITASSTLLEKITWFQVVCDDLSAAVALRKLDSIGELAKVPDWGRALFAGYLNVEAGNRFAQSTLELEMQEAAEVGRIEGRPVKDIKALDDAMNTIENETVVTDQQGHSTIRVIGADTFFAASQRHLLSAISKSDDWLRNMLGTPDEASQFETQMTSQFGDLPHFIIVSQNFPVAPGTNRLELTEVLRNKGAMWTPTDLPPGELFRFFFADKSSAATLNEFYQEGEPAGTVYDVGRRSKEWYLLNIDPKWHLSHYAYSDKDPNRVLRHYYEQLQQLDPDSWTLTARINELTTLSGTFSMDQAMAKFSRFMDYCEEPFYVLLNDRHDSQLSLQTEETLDERLAAFEPYTYFSLGKVLRKEGRADDAAAADRKGAALSLDLVGMANSIQPLVEYDLAHGKSDEALDLGKRAADVFSAQGIETYIYVLEKMGRLDEAETWAKSENERYQDPTALDALYLTNPDHFLNQATALKKDAFPEGEVPASVATFKDAPERGAIFKTDSEYLNDAGLYQSDVVVALNSVKVENIKQYDVVRNQTRGTDMDLIVWQKGAYHEVHASPASHRFGVEMTDYPVR